MNRFNPLHIGLLLITLLAYLVFTLNDVKTQIVEEQKSFKQTEELAVTLSSLKDVYADKKATQSAFQRVLAQPSLKAAKLDVKETKSSVKVSSNSIDSSVLNSLMGKVLNGSYNIVELKIKKINETTASLSMEIQW